jgi:hypothetical protein
MDFLTSGTFYFILGILFLATTIGANAWFGDMGLEMNWWKWTLTIIWWFLLWGTLAAPMTLLAEREPKGALGVFGIAGVITIILGVGLWRLLMAGHKKTATN